jgi:soluble lytic murein transglycosylase-like protein
MFASIIVPVSLVLLIGGAISFGFQKPAAAGGECAVSERFPEQVFQWCSLVTEQARENGLHPDLLAALIWLESGGSPEAYSHSGAVGLMQVMPRDGLAESFQCPKGPCFKDRPTIAELLDPDYNVRYGAHMLGGLIKETGDIREALHLYGPMDVGYRYADNILALFNRYGNP